jgi:hypothetical protein
VPNAVSATDLGYFSTNKTQNLDISARTTLGQPSEGIEPMEKSNPRRSLSLRAVYALCLALATLTHVILDLRYGLLLGGLESLGYPAFVRIYWASLTFLDPLCALLLFIRPRAGVILCAGIIVTDVLNNSWVGYQRSELDFGYILQVAFLIFVVTTAKCAWQGLSPNSKTSTKRE